MFRTVNPLANIEAYWNVAPTPGALGGSAPSRSSTGLFIGLERLTRNAWRTKAKLSLFNGLSGRRVTKAKPRGRGYRSPVSAERFASLYRVTMASSFLRPRAMVLGPAGRYPLEV